jgi:hypothetical protein
MRNEAQQGRGCVKACQEEEARLSYDVIVFKFYDKGKLVYVSLSGNFFQNNYLQSGITLHSC